MATFRRALDGRRLENLTSSEGSYSSFRFFSGNFGLTATVMAAAHAQGVDPALTSATWHVVEVEGAQTTYAETLQFAEHRVAGKGACNRFSAGLKQAGQALEIGQPVATRIFCQGRMDAEKRYFDALHAARSYALNAATLSLNAADGHTLVKLTK
jgi:heat shock protein HslJ